MPNVFPIAFRGIAGLPQFRDEKPRRTVSRNSSAALRISAYHPDVSSIPTLSRMTVHRPRDLVMSFGIPCIKRWLRLDIPALVHSASGCHPREPYTLKFLNEESIAIISLLDSRVF